MFDITFVNKNKIVPTQKYFVSNNEEKTANKSPSIRFKKLPRVKKLDDKIPFYTF